MGNRQWIGAERVRFYDGALLAARDLQDDSDYEAWLRGLHVRALHNTWGVALGFNLDLSDDRRQVLVGPGLAYDCRGREILLAETIGLDGPLPPAGNAARPLVFELVIRYRTPEDRAALQSQAAVCLDPGLGLAEERPAFRWVLAGEADAVEEPPLLAGGVRLGEDIPLGRFEMDAEGVLSDPDLRVRRHARPLLRPHIAFGLTRPGELTWEQTDFGLVTEVDTRAAGFSTTPFYFATLAQNPWFDDLSTPPWSQIVGPFVSIAQPEQTRFRLQLLFAAQTTDAAVALPRVLMERAGQASVFWVGVEPVTGCPPVINLDWFFSLAGYLVRDLVNWSYAIARLTPIGLIVE